MTAAIDELAAAYADAGVRAWTVWVPDYDRRSAEMLAERGHVLDGAPRTMGLDLDDLRPPAEPLPAGVELVAGGVGDARGDQRPRLRHRGAGLERGDGARAGSGARDPARRTSAASRSPARSSSTITATRPSRAVATLPEHRGKGLAGWIITELLRSARERGMSTGSLQASRAGAPVYERLGFADVGFVELWERREP